MPLSSSLLAKKNTRHLLKKRPPKRLNGVNNVNCKFQENHLSIQCMQIRVHLRFEFDIGHLIWITTLNYVTDQKWIFTIFHILYQNYQHKITTKIFRIKNCFWFFSPFFDKFDFQRLLVFFKIQFLSGLMIILVRDMKKINSIFDQ